MRWRRRGAFGALSDPGERPADQSEAIDSQRRMARAADERLALEMGDAGAYHRSGERIAIMAAQDDCLIAVTNGWSLPTKALAKLPPWRAVLVARVAAKAGVGLERGTLGQLVAEARHVGGHDVLGPWWERTLEDVAGNMLEEERV